MPRVPNELILAIVQQVGDVQSLKCCSLAGSVFRVPSQRILLRSLTLHANPPNYRAALHFLHESPYVAAYIVVLRIWVPKGTAPSDVQSFMQVLHQLKHVRECTLGGNPPLTMPMHVLPFSWAYVSAEISFAIFRFLGRQSLRRLSIVEIEQLSASALLRLLTFAPEITFNSASVASDLVLVSDSPGNGSQEISPLRRLTINEVSSSIFQLLRRPQYAFHAGSLRELGILAHGDEYVHAHAFMCLVAKSLETLEFSCSFNGAMKVAVLPPPPLPVLRSVQFLISTLDCSAAWFQNTILSILDPGSSPVLAQVRLILIPRSTSSWDIDQTLMSALDDALDAHPANPSITCCVPFPTLDGAVPWMQGMMPRTHGKGRLIVDVWHLGNRFDGGSLYTPNTRFN